MLLPKNFINNKIFMFLRFRSIFFSSDILAFYMLNKIKMSELDLLKQNLFKNNLNFQFFNNNFISHNFSNLNVYFNSFYGSFMVVYFKSFNDLFKLSLDNCYLFSCLYNGYFINNVFFSKLNFYNFFFDKNYLFIISFLMYFVKLYLNLILYIKFILFSYLKLRIEQVKK
jgi:hypothetical protein